MNLYHKLRRQISRADRPPLTRGQVVILLILPVCGVLYSGGLMFGAFNDEQEIRPYSVSVPNAIIDQSGTSLVYNEDVGGPLISDDLFIYFHEETDRVGKILGVLDESLVKGDTDFSENFRGTIVDTLDTLGQKPTKYRVVGKELLDFDEGSGTMRISLEYRIPGQGTPVAMSYQVVFATDKDGKTSLEQVNNTTLSNLT